MKENIQLCEATTEEIIEELFNRTTFAGVIVHSLDNHKFAGQQHSQFELKTTCDCESAIAMLTSGIKSIKNQLRRN